MNVIECKEIDLSKYGLSGDKKIMFLRIEPDDLSKTIKDILIELADLSWLSKFDKEYVKKSMQHNADITCQALKNKFYDSSNDPIIEEAGEYIVSVLSKKGIVESLNHKDIPLAELLGRRKTGNSGFDFFTENTATQLISCGEAKYIKGVNAYNTSLLQINRFISEKKHISDIILLQSLAEDASLDNLSNNKFGVCSAFSTNAIESNKLITNICKNTEFVKTLSYEFVILVAVNIA